MNKYIGVIAAVIAIGALVAVCTLVPASAGSGTPTVTPPPVTPLTNWATITPVVGYPAPATATPPSNPYPGPELAQEKLTNLIYLPITTEMK